VLRVLDVQFEQQVIKGIVDWPGYRCRYYSEEEQALLDRPAPDGHPIQDDEIVARDVERLVGIPAEVAGEVLLAQIEYREECGTVADGPGLPPHRPASHLMPNSQHTFCVEHQSYNDDIAFSLDGW